MRVTFTVNNLGFYFSDWDVVNPHDYIPAGEYNPHNVRPWLFHEYGVPIGVVFANCIQDAWDELADSGKLDRFQLTEEDLADYAKYEAGTARLGNAGETFDIHSLRFLELPNPAFSFAALFAAAKGN